MSGAYALFLQLVAISFTLLVICLIGAINWVYEGDPFALIAVALMSIAMVMYARMAYKIRREYFT